jgi:sulfur carrier protein
MSECAAFVNITVDGMTHLVASGTSLADVVEALGHAPQSVATAVNGSFVARHARAGLHLQPGDQVSFFQPIVGG